MECRHSVFGSNDKLLVGAKQIDDECTVIDRGYSIAFRQPNDSYQKAVSVPMIEKWSPREEIMALRAQKYHSTNKWDI